MYIGKYRVGPSHRHVRATNGAVEAKIYQISKQNRGPSQDFQVTFFGVKHLLPHDIENAGKYPEIHFILETFMTQDIKSSKP